MQIQRDLRTGQPMATPLAAAGQDGPRSNSLAPASAAAAATAAMSARPRSQSSAASLLPHPPLPASASIISPTVEASLVNATGRTRAVSRGRSSRPTTAGTLPAAYPSDSGASDYFSAAPLQNSAVKPSTAEYPLPPLQGLHPDSTKAFEQSARRTLYGDEWVKASSNSSTPHYGATREPAAPARRLPPRARTEHPQYPDQSFAALQSQVYPPPYRSPFNFRSGPPTQGLSPLMSLATHHNRESPSDKPVKHASFTPAQSPGVSYRPYVLQADGLDDSSPYPSPYLHPTQLQPPRTVTNAERGVDFVSGRKCINHYEILDELGRGVHGKVKLARNLDNDELVAIKIVQRFSKRKRLGKASSPEDKVKKEIAILKKVQHPNVVRMIEVIDDPDINKVYIVLEFCELKEIAWRHPGTAEIVLLENRRLEKESAGSIQTHEDIRRTEKLIEGAARRRELQRQEAIKLQSRRPKSASAYWSLEYAGETDEEDFDVPTPIARGLIGYSSRTSRANEDPASTSETPRAIPRSKSKSSLHRTLSTSPLERRKMPLEIAAEEWFQSSASIEQSATQKYSQPPTLEQHDKDFSANVAEALLRRGRKSSTTGSDTSQITEVMEEEVPEDARFVPTMTIPECRVAFRDALVGLHYLHFHGIIHRDIKPANLLRTRDHRVKISDFGVSYLGKPMREGPDSTEASESEGRDIEEETELAKTVGTPAFYAPELCSLDLMADTPHVTNKIDLWALGVTLYCLLFARTPFTAENEYVLMRRIAEEDVFIPRHRLKALDTSPSSRSSSHGPRFKPATDRRLPDQFHHEDIEDDLYDLLRRLFIKDPNKRMNIMEVKHHPWVLKGIPNPSAWIDETDPTHFGQGKKIEISKEEVAEAVAPLKVIERLRSITGRAGRALGLNRTGRKRTPTVGSTASSDAGSSTSARSGQDLKGHDGRRASMRGEDSALAAFKASKDRDADHPLSKSLTASPDLEEYPQQRADARPRQYSTDLSESFGGGPTDRPGMPERHASEWSNAGSIRTLRPSDVERGRRGSPSNSQAANQGAPQTAEESQQHEHGVAYTLGALFGGAGRHFLRSVRSRERYSATSRSPARSVPESEASTDYLAGEPSVALSNTSVSGRMSTTSAMKDEVISSSSVSSPLSSAKASKETSSDSLNALSANIGTGASSPASAPRSQPIAGVLSGPGSPRYPVRDGANMSEAQYNQALDNLVRRREIEDAQAQEQSNSSRPTSWYSQSACPPSPDDVPTTAGEQPSQGRQQHTPLLAQYQAQAVSSTSSENNITPLSLRSSLPSVPSASSAISSLAPDADAETESSVQGDYTSDPSMVASVHLSASDELPGPGPFLPLGPTESAYLPIRGDYEAAIDSDNDLSDDSDGGFLVMNRRKSTNHGGSRPATRGESPPPPRQRSKGNAGAAAAAAEGRGGTGGGRKSSSSSHHRHHHHHHHHHNNHNNDAHHPPHHHRKKSSRAGSTNTKMKKKTTTATSTTPTTDCESESASAAAVPREEAAAAAAAAAEEEGI